MPTTTNFALPYPASTATVNVSGDIQALATATDTALATVSADKPHAFLRQTSNQSIVFGAWTAVTFDTEDVDTHSGHSTSVNTSRYTAAVAGWYHVVGRGSFAANSTGHRGVRIAKNGSVVNGSASYFQAATSDVWSSAGVADVHLNVGEYVEVQVIQDAAAGGLNTAASAGDVAPSMSVFLINAD
jgi:hypothetical protein